MKTLSFFFLLAASVNSFAQNVEPKNELGLNLYGFEFNVNPTVFKGNNPQSVYFNGAQYKRAISEKYNLRLAGQYFTKSKSDAGTLLYQSIIAGNDGTYAYNINEKGFETRVGIERTFLKKKIRPFVFADLVYRQVNTRATFLTSGDWQEENSKSRYGGALCGIGVKYYPIKQLYFSLESSIGYYDNLGRGENQVLLSPVKTIAFGVRF